MTRWLASSASLAVLALVSPASAEEIKFEHIVVDPQFMSEGVAIGDFNRDGRMDVYAGDLWYENQSSGEWKRHPVRKPIDKYDGKEDGTYDYAKGYSNSFANFAHDFNGDGWTDVVVVEFPGLPFHWYENPKGADGMWKEHEVWRSGCNESPQFADLFGNGKPGVVLGYQPEAQVGFLRPGTDPTAPWEPIAISASKSPGTDRFWHGLGVGDVNLDGRHDVIINVGWWEQPMTVTGAPWTFHPAELSPPKRQPSDPPRENPACADMHAYDVDGDGDQDILASAAHMYGVWWYEQVPGGGENPKFVPHVIDDSFSQSHALNLVDMNGDGLKDLVTGKRYFAHQGHDPGALEPVVLYWFELQRKDGKAQFIPHKIDTGDAGTGHGTQFVVADFNGDRLPDIVTSNKKGTHVLLQKRP